MGNKKYSSDSEEYSDSEKKKKKRGKDKKGGERSRGRSDYHTSDRSTTSSYAQPPGYTTQHSENTQYPVSGGYGYASPPPPGSGYQHYSHAPPVPPQSGAQYGHSYATQPTYSHPQPQPPPNLQQYPATTGYPSAGYTSPPPPGSGYQQYPSALPQSLQSGAQYTQSYTAQPTYAHTSSTQGHAGQGYNYPQAQVGGGHYAPPASIPPAEEYGPYHAYRASGQDMNLHQAPEHTRPGTYHPKYHSTAQESTFAALKLDNQPSQGLSNVPAGPPPPASTGASGGGIFGLFNKKTKPQDIFSTFASTLQASLHDTARVLFPPSTTHSNPYYPSIAGSTDLQSAHRFNSFAPLRTSVRHQPKWYVDGKDYMWAVSCALENAKHTIWILDWWLSPELNLRRPASKWTFPGDPPGGRYRLDNMLAAAAARGVEVKVIVYKEVEAALTLNSHYTKKALEARNLNIAVMRHPDHVPDATNTITDITDIVTAVKDKYQFGDFLKSLYGMKDGKVLFWAHHEKMVLVDAGWGEGQEKGFMGGLDLCFGRWDTNEHPIADLRENTGSQIFLGQDYNNARIMDFHQVENWTQNKLDRSTFSRMGWSDVAFSVQGPILKDLAMHFIQRWNFIYDVKYRIRFSGGERYKKLPELSNADDPKVRRKLHGMKEKMKVKLGDYSHQGYGGGPYGQGGYTVPEQSEHPYEGAVQGSPYVDSDDEGLGDRDGVRCQLLRSASKWSNGAPQTEHSICNAYIETILKAQHFIYIENQFFITATSPKQSPILNLIGAAIVERILRAFTSKLPFKIIIVMPSVPAFAGDLQAEGSIGTRAIMEFQYRSIIRDRGYSIIETLENNGIPKDQIKNYIGFFNLRNYDRINYTGRTDSVENQSVAAEDQARQELGRKTTGMGYGPYGSSGRVDEGEISKSQLPQKLSPADRNASIARCTMLGGGDIREVQWYGPPEKEIEAFVSEELYIHSKIMIADDRTVICGSANLNDRSQLGDHDSEIAMIIEDPTPLPSVMAGQPYIASHFAATLRRQIFRKHLGLIPAQTLDDVDENMSPSPVPNIYDFDSAEDRLVADPLGDEFTRLWYDTARVNTDCFRRVFRPVPDDGIRTWKQYDEWFGVIFTPPKEKEEELKRIERKEGVPEPPPPKAEELWGHVVRRDFSQDPVQAAQEVKKILALVRGSLVEMPLHFLEEEDIAKEGVQLNAFTETVYT